MEAFHRDTSTDLEAAVIEAGADQVEPLRREENDDIPVLAASANTLGQFRTLFGEVDVELFDQDKPVTVRNFMRYVQSGAYGDLFFHGWVPQFVLQGGGYTVPGRGTGTNSSIHPVLPVFGTITNEYGAGRTLSNVYGTLAMARVAGQTNSASSQWFFNLTNNVFLDSAAQFRVVDNSPLASRRFYRLRISQ